MFIHTITFPSSIKLQLRAKEKTCLKQIHVNLVLQASSLKRSVMQCLFHCWLEMLLSPRLQHLKMYFLSTVNTDTYPQRQEVALTCLISFHTSHRCVNTGITEGRSEAPPSSNRSACPPIFRLAPNNMYALLTKWRCRRQRRNSPETYSCSVGTEDFCAYSLLPSAVGRGDPEASHSPHQHKSIRICNNLWFPGISNTCISLNPKSTQEQLSMKSHQSQNLLLRWF